MWKSVLVFYECCNKKAQTGWPKTTEIYCVVVVEAVSPKSGFQQGCASSEIRMQRGPFCLF